MPTLSTAIRLISRHAPRHGHELQVGGLGQGQPDVNCGLCGMFELRQVRVNANVVNVQPKIEFELELEATEQQQQCGVDSEGGNEGAGGRGVGVLRALVKCVTRCQRPQWSIQRSSNP